MENNLTAYDKVFNNLNNIKKAKYSFNVNCATSFVTFNAKPGEFNPFNAETVYQITVAITNAGFSPRTILKGQYTLLIKLN
jgi:hypothetical protein